MNRSAMRRLSRTFAILTTAIVLPLTLAACGQDSAPVQPATERPPLEGAKIGGPFALVDKDGKPVRWEDFQGKYRAVYFGYTFCPDACPLDVQVMMQGFARFEKEQPQRAARLQPLFITIDPERDTQVMVGEFAAAFSPRLIGLTGTSAQVDQAARAFAVYYKRGTETSGGYLMDHSRIAYLMGPKGEPITMLPVDKDGEAVAAELAKWVK